VLQSFVETARDSPPPKETSSNPLRAGGVLDRVNRVFVICKGAGVFDGDGSRGSALVDGSGDE
jgi:hypothetical protein